MIGTSTALIVVITLVILAVIGVLIYVGYMKQASKNMPTTPEYKIEAKSLISTNIGDGDNNKIKESKNDKKDYGELIF